MSIGLLPINITPPPLLGASKSFGSDFLDIKVTPQPAGLPEDDLFEKPGNRRPLEGARRGGCSRVRCIIHSNGKNRGQGHVQTLTFQPSNDALFN